jgi:hypothetical protein
VLEWAKDVENSIQCRTLFVLPNVVQKCLEFVLFALPQESLWAHAIQHFVTLRDTPVPLCKPFRTLSSVFRNMPLRLPTTNEV